MNGTGKIGAEFKRKIKDITTDIKRRVKSVLSALASAVRGCTAVKFITKSETVDSLIRIFKCAGLTVLGFLFGICSIVPMAYPLGFAFMIASGRLTFFVYAGSAVAALTYPGPGFAFFGVNTLIYIIRKILLSDNFSESRKARIILGILSSLFISFALLLSYSSGGIPREAISFGLIPCCLCYIFGLPLAILLFYPVTSEERFTGAGARLSLGFLCLCIIMSCSDIGISWLPYFAACICTLVFCTFFEGNSGIPAGAFFGLAVPGHSFCASLCIGAFLFLRLCEKKQIAAYPMFALCIYLISALTVSGTELQIIMRSVICGTLIFMPFGMAAISKRIRAELSAPLMREAVTEGYTRRMAALSGAFGAVSKLCFGFSGRMRFPSEDEACSLVSVTCAKSCSKCSEFRSCRKKKYWCDKGIAANLMSGKLTVSVLPEILARSCQHVSAITDKINGEYTKLLADRFNNNKTEILAAEYASMGKILKYTSRISSEDVYYDGKLTALAGNATKKLGLKNGGVTVYGTRKKTLDISSVPVSCISMPSDKIAQFYSSNCSELFDTPEFILDEDGTFTVRMKSKELICTEYVTASHTKNGETVSGDTVSFFRSDDSYFYALIADGMGSGRDASMTSKLTSVFVEKLLSGGAGKGATIELLNNLLMTNNRECFSGVDLLEIDLIKKKASFVKAGAAPAYLLRSTKLFKVSSDTPPCGIIEGFCAENTSFEIMPGDIIIMMSDGITSSIDCGTALCDIMNTSKGQPLENIAGKILDMAVSLTVHDDDMSCVIVKIK